MQCKSFSSNTLDVNVLLELMEMGIILDASNVTIYYNAFGSVIIMCKKAKYAIDGIIMRNIIKSHK